MCINREVSVFQRLHIPLKVEIRHHNRLFCAQNIFNSSLKWYVSIAEHCSARKKVKLHRCLNSLRNDLETIQMLTINFLATPRAINNDRLFSKRGVLQSILQWHRRLRTPRNQNKSLRIVLACPISYLGFTSSNPVIYLCPEGTHGMTVVTHLNRRDAHVGENNTLDTHANIRKIGHRKVVWIDSR